jgi:hypothetical protein
MRIYPDPELPDLTVRWQDFDCTDGGNVTITVTGIDTMMEQTVACSDLMVKFVNVAREQYQVVGRLDTGAAMPGMAEEPVDLRAGFNKTIDLFFQSFFNFQVEWTFAVGQSCALLAADTVVIYISSPDVPDQFGFSGFCTDGFIGNGLTVLGTYTAHLAALSGDKIVARSPETPPFDITDGGLTDLGLQTLTACGSACP